MAALTTIVVTWMDGAVATYEDVTHSTREGSLFIYKESAGVPIKLWQFPTSNIRAVGSSTWQPDNIMRYAADGQVQHDAT